MWNKETVLFSSCQSALHRHGAGGGDTRRCPVHCQRVNRHPLTASAPLNFSVHLAKHAKYMIGATGGLTPRRSPGLC
jgi:hypothetical protein